MNAWRRALAALCMVPWWLGAPAQAAHYPNHAIRLIVPYAVGGAADTVARSIAQKMTEAMGQTVFVDNRAGANGMIGSEMTAKAEPDGYTLLMQLGPSHGTLQFFTRNVPYDPVKDFTPIAIIGTAPQALVVNASLPVHNLAEFIAYAKAHRGQLSYGTSQHLGGELLKAMAGIDMTHVPYKGGSLALNDVVGGQVPVGILVLSNVLPHVQAGKLRLLGVLQGHRASATPDVPTLGEAGVPGYSIPDTWVGLLGPAHMPAPVVETIRGVVEKALAAPDLRARLDTAGFEVATSVSPQAFAKQLEDSVAIYTKIVERAGIKPE